MPVTSPRLSRPPPAAGAVAEIATVSPSSRNDRVEPSASVSGSAPFQVSSMSDPRWPGSGPDTVPEAKRSPARVEAPLTVMWASIWSAVQYIVANGGRDTTEPLSATSIDRSRPHGPLRRRYGSGAGSCAGPSTRAAPSASSGTTQGDIDVANDLPRNGPSGWYSHAWMSRALQSLSSTSPKTWSAKASTGTGSPSAEPTPTTKP